MTRNPLVLVIHDDFFRVEGEGGSATLENSGSRVDSCGRNFWEIVHDVAR